MRYYKAAGEMERKKKQKTRMREASMCRMSKSGGVDFAAVKVNTLMVISCHLQQIHRVVLKSYPDNNKIH